MNLQAADLPLLARRVDARSREAAQQPKPRRRGGCSNTADLTLNHHPVCGIKELSRLFLDAAATPPAQEGQSARPENSFTLRYFDVTTLVGGCGRKHQALRHQKCVARRDAKIIRDNPEETGALLQWIRREPDDMHHVTPDNGDRRRRQPVFSMNSDSASLAQACRDLLS